MLPASNCLTAIAGNGFPDLLPDTSEFDQDYSNLPPAGNTLRDSLISQLAAELLQPLIRALPFQVAEPLPERNIVAKGGQLPVKHSLLTSLRQVFRQACGAAGRYRFQPPLARVVRDRLQMLKARKHCGR